MARGFIQITNTGLTEIADYLEKLADSYDTAILESVKAMQDPVVERIKMNWVSMVGGTPGGYVFDSIGKSTAMSQTDPHTVVGTVGVYNLDKVNSAHGKTKKDLNAAQIAYWVEYGTSRLRSGLRKQKGQEYADEDVIQVSAKPFLGNAFYTSIDEQNEAFKMKFNTFMDQIK